MNFKYSDYCTAYYVPEDNTVRIYDEMKNREMQKIPVTNEQNAAEVMREWLRDAPSDIIAELLN